MLKEGNIKKHITGGSILNPYHPVRYAAFLQ